MKEVQEELLNKRRQRGSAGSQPLVVRHSDNDFQLEVREALSRLEAVIQPLRAAAKVTYDNSSFASLDFKGLAALGAILLSLAGYVIQEARNSSRQDAEIEATRVRVTTVEKVAAANTEARIRLEVELAQLRDGQADIKRLLLTHENETRRFLRTK